MAVYKDKEKTKDGRQWRFKVYYKDSEGKLKAYTSKRFLLEKEAKAEERVFILNRDNPIKKRFDLVAEDYFKDAFKRIKESTVLSYYSVYKNNIKPYFKNKFIDEISVLDITNWKNKIMDRKISVASANQYYVVFKEIFTFANKKYELNYNPVELSGRFKRRNDVVVEDKSLKYITYDQFQQLLSVIKDDMWYTFFTTLYLTGMRKGEIQALKWQDIDFSSNVIKVFKTVSFNTRGAKFKITNTKNYLNREISMSRILKEELIKYKKKVMQYSDYSNDWFVFGGGDVLSDHQINKHRIRYFKESNLENYMITIHQFRHSHVSVCINEYLKSGGTDTTKFFLMMSQRMGHSLRVMQEVYLHLFPQTQDKIVNLLDNL
jgi:integrase